MADITGGLADNALSSAYNTIIIIAWVLIPLILVGGLIVILWLKSMWKFRVTVYDLVRGSFIRSDKKGAVRNIKGVNRFVVQGFSDSLPPPDKDMIYKDNKGKKCIDLIMVNNKHDYLNLNRYKILRPDELIRGDWSDKSPDITNVKSHKEFWAMNRIREKFEAYKDKQHILLQILPIVTPVVVVIILAVILIVLFEKLEIVAGAIEGTASYCRELQNAVNSVQVIQ